MFDGELTYSCNSDSNPDPSVERNLVPLSGKPGTPVLCPVPLASIANELLDLFRATSGTEVLVGTNGNTLLTQRASITASQPHGNQSHNGFCRLLPSSDGMLGVNLPRDSDWELIPAWLEVSGVTDWDQLGDVLCRKPSATLVERARLLGLAVVDATIIPREVPGWKENTVIGQRLTKLQRKRPRVIDLSSLWAGPLCSHLWQLAGAEVTKVESTQRPDGARNGSAEFFQCLNSGKHHISLDLQNDKGRSELRELIHGADIVLEASRPRALRQMGLVAEDILREQPGLTWLSITGFGRQEPEENWIAYGDDAGIAAGLSAVTHQAAGEWTIIGDAIADPLTGLQAAIAGWSAWQAGGGQLVDLSLERTVRHCITATAPEDGDYRKRHLAWSQQLGMASSDSPPHGKNQLHHG